MDGDDYSLASAQRHIKPNKNPRQVSTWNTLERREYRAQKVSKSSGLLLFEHSPCTYSILSSKSSV